jgi:chemotaxis-related protein WspB
MLLLNFRVAENAYAVDAGRVVEVVPRVELRPVPHAPAHLAGLFDYRGRVVPVIDLGLLMGSAACREGLSTRLILVRYPLGGAGDVLLGLVVEHLSEVSRVAGREAFAPAMHVPAAPYLGPILRADGRLVQLIEVEHVLSESLRECLFGAVAAAAEPS